MSQFLPLDCSRGAPMGRDPYGIASDCPPRSIRLFRVNLDSDGYDDGGAYWGLDVHPGSGPVYCARYGDTYRAFARASDRSKAALALRIPRALLRAPQGISV